MRIAKFRDRSGNSLAGIVDGELIRPLLAGTDHSAVTQILESTDPVAAAKSLVDSAASQISLADVQLLAPIDKQEVWAAGVTYKRSMAARMEESESAATL